MKGIRLGRLHKPYMSTNSSRFGAPFVYDCASALSCMYPHVVVDVTGMCVDAAPDGGVLAHAVDELLELGCANEA